MDESEDEDEIDGRRLFGNSRKGVVDVKAMDGKEEKKVWHETRGSMRFIYMFYSGTVREKPVSGDRPCGTRKAVTHSQTGRALQNTDRAF